MKENNFNFLRLLAAIGVLWSHAYPLSLGKGVHDPLEQFLGFEFGRLSVDVFFFASGYLICGSAARSSSPIKFFINRFLRIYPGLWARLCVTSALYLIFEIGSLGSRVVVQEVVSYLATNSTLARGAIDFSLSGAFVNNPFPNVVNGALWTLPWELRMYGLLAILYFIVPISKSFLLILVFALAAMVEVFHGLGLFEVAPILGIAARFSAYFFFGALFKNLAPSWRPSLKVLVLAFGSALASILVYKPMPYIIYFLLVPILVLGVAFTVKIPEKLRELTRLDISYGVYLYGFPVEQLIAHQIPGVQPIQMFFLAVPCTILCGYFSYVLVEERCLKLKDPFFTQWLKFKSKVAF